MKFGKMLAITISPTRKRLFENFTMLMVLQGMNYLFPLITLPYLVRILGPERYGLIAFAQALIGYFIMVTDYGFNLSATREISIHRDDKQKISEIFSSVMTVKFILMLMCFFILTAIIQIDKFKKDWLVYYFTFGIVIGQLLFPLWLFLGTENMKYITILMTIDRAVFTISIFVFIRTAQDYIYVPFLNSCGYLVSGILSLVVTIYHFKVKFHFPTKQNIFHQLRDSWNSFLGATSISLFSNTNTFLLGLFASNTAVGYYAAAEKLVNAILRLVQPVSQTLYPHISKMVVESKRKAVKFIQKSFYLVGIGSLLVSFAILIGAYQLVDLIFGEQYYQSIVVLKILSLSVFLTALSNIIGFQTMLTFKMDRVFSRILISAYLFNIICAIILAPILRHIGVAIGLVLTFLLVVFVMLWYLNSKGINIMTGKISQELENPPVSIF
ncbi:MAG: flippase [Bacteroidales bacterium]